MFFYSHRLFVLVTVIVYFIVHFLSPYYVNGVRGYQRGNRKRVVAVVKIQFIMILLSVFMYHRLMSLIDHFCGGTLPTVVNRSPTVVNRSPTSRITYRREWMSIGVGMFMFLAHFAYFVYWLSPFFQLLIFELCNLCLGLWTNLGPILLGFWLIGFVTQLLQSLTLSEKALRALFLRLPSLRIWLLDSEWHCKVSLVVAIVMSMAMWLGKDRILIKERVFYLRDLPKEDIRLAMLSDLHAGASVYRDDRRQIERAVQLTNGLENVEAVVIVGDSMDGTPDDLRSRLEPLKELRKDRPVFYVTGNHDYYYGDVNDWLTLFRSWDIEVLLNQHRQLSKGICLAGVADLSSASSGVPGHEMDIAKAVNGCQSTQPIVTLSHNPAAVFNISAYKKGPRPVDLVLSGHTHAGQFYTAWPMVYWILPFFYGHYQVGETQLFVSAGTLYQGPSMKLLAMSEIWLITLRRWSEKDN